jgi:hypothetical protein
MSGSRSRFERAYVRLHRIPREWEHVTPEWMTKAIGRHHPDARVGEVTLTTRDDGTNRRARFAVTYSAGTGPRSVFLKAHAPAHRIVHLRNGNLFNEARLFKSGISLPLDHPLVYQSIVDWLRLDFLLVMEDLNERQADPRDATRPMTVDQVANGLRSLAKLHSQYWGFSAATRPQLKWVKTWAPTQGWQVGLRKRIPMGRKRADGMLADGVTKYTADEIVALWARYVSSLTRGPMTLLHADAHIGNTYVLPNETVGFLDWQVVRRGGWSQDVGYFLVGSLTEEDRRHGEAQLLEEYRQALELPHSQLPTTDDIWQRYRTTPAYGFAIWLSTLGTDGWQRPEISLALAQRFASAFADLRTHAALNDSRD